MLLTWYRGIYFLGLWWQAILCRTVGLDAILTPATKKELVQKIETKPPTQRMIKVGNKNPS